MDGETGLGLVTDVCLTRMVRNYVQIANGLVNGFDIFIKEKAVQNTLIDNAHDD
ncbi:type I CRISPR-associated protein Cas7 [Phocaeicola vulgatus]|nr:type I CRISPR-associated protein Cas7 [Phocaeicola vulgatus]